MTVSLAAVAAAATMFMGVPAALAEPSPTSPSVTSTTTGSTSLPTATPTATSPSAPTSATTVPVGPIPASGSAPGSAPASSAATSTQAHSALAAVGSPGTYAALAPARVLDTRSNLGGTGPVAAHGTVHLQVLGKGGVPAADVSAVVVNVTVTGPKAGGSLTVYPDGTAMPIASNLNFVTGQTIPNLVIAKVGANGKIALTNNTAGTLQLIADVAGYYLGGAPAIPGAYAPLTPARVLDTRSNLGGTGPVPANGTVHLQVLGAGGVPATDVSAVVVNVTVTRPQAGGSLTVYPDGSTKPTASNLNFVTGQTIPNLVIAKVGANGKIALTNTSTGTLHLIADVAGYYRGGTAAAPGAYAPLAPARTLDTRSNLGGTGPVAAHGTVHLQVLGKGGVPATLVSAVVVNVTVTGPKLGGSLTVYPDDAPIMPTASNLNFVTGQTIPNLVIAKVGANGKIALTNNSGGTVQLIADIAGYYLAAPPTPTGVSGTVTDAAGTHHGLAGVKVSVYSGKLLSNDTFGPPVTGVTDATGGYTVTGLAAGTYSICFNGWTATGGSGDAFGYVYACYLDRPFGDVVHVASGAITAGLDEALVTGGVVTGTVTDAGGTHAPLAGVVASITGENSKEPVPVQATTRADGTYTLRGVPAKAAVDICFDGSAGTGGSSDLTGYTDDCHSPAVSVAQSATTTGADVALAGGGAITGTITDAGGTHHGLAGVTVTTFGPRGEFARTATTSTTGTYRLSGLPAATGFQVCASPDVAKGGSNDTLGYLSSCHVGNVAVSIGAATTGVNVALSHAGGISGTVTDAAGTHQGLVGVHVEVTSQTTNWSGSADTSAGGAYSVVGVQPGTDYQVCFDATSASGGSTDANGYTDRCYNNVPVTGVPTPVAVAAGANHSGVNAALTTGGSVAGTVTDAGGTHHGLAGVSVVVDSPTTTITRSSQTNADGSYRVPGLATGADYTVCFSASSGDAVTGGSNDGLGYVDQCYNGKTPTGPSTPVAVTVGAVKTGVNAVLADAGGVSGVVTDAGGSHHVLAGVSVNVTSAAQSWSGSATTAADGSYTVKNLTPATDYSVCFYGGGATGGSTDTLGYVDECYDNQPPSGTPTSVSVTGATAHTGVNAALSSAGGVSGTVTDANGTHHGLRDVTVTVMSATTNVSLSSNTSTDGTYFVAGLPPGSDYTVCFDSYAASGGSSDALGYVNQCYNNRPVTGTPTPVTVGSGTTRTGVNASLARGAAITGTVTDAGGTHHGLAGVDVEVRSDTTGFTGSAGTATDGTYTVTGLPAGSDYTVCFLGAALATGGSNDPRGYSDQCYNNQPTTGTPTAVTVTAGTAKPGINAALHAAGAISGTVTEAAGTHHGLGGVFVSVNSDTTGINTYALTNDDGTYSVPGLSAGTDYTVCFSMSGATGGASRTGYVDQCYNNKPLSATPTPVTVTNGATRTAVNAAAVAAGAISGKVTDAAGTHHGLAGVTVDVSTDTAGTVASALTGDDGSYVVTGVPAGAGYSVCFDPTDATGGSSDTVGYVAQCYNNVPPGGSTPTPVTVTVGVTKTGVNGALRAGGALSGTVTDTGGTHHALANVAVNVYSGTTASNGYTTTAADGTYRITGLAAATDYAVCFSGMGATGGSSDPTGYVDECYNNQPSSGSPTPVAVTAGATRTGVNAALAGAGAISGTVTDAGGTHHGLADVGVEVFSETTGSSGYVGTAADGTYTVTGLAAGTDYQVCFFAESASGGSNDAKGYADECYNNQPPEGTGTPTPVIVTVGATRTGVNAALTDNP